MCGCGHVCTKKQVRERDQLISYQGKVASAKSLALHPSCSHPHTNTHTRTSQDAALCAFSIFYERAASHQLELASLYKSPAIWEFTRLSLCCLLSSCETLKLSFDCALRPLSLSFSISLPPSLALPRLTFKPGAEAPLLRVT